MKLFSKIIGIGVVGLLIASFIAGTAAYTGAKLRIVQDDMEKALAFRAEIMSAKEAHLLWLRSIDDAIINAKPELSVGTDGKLCAFGKWYYSEEAAALVASMSSEIQEHYQNIETDHLEVHRLGGDLIAMWNKDDIKSCTTFLQEKIVPKAGVLIDKLTELVALTSRQVRSVHTCGEQIVRTQNLAIWSVLALGTAALLSYSWMTARRIVRPLNVCGRIFSGIAKQGIIDMDVPDDVLQRRDEIGDLGRNVTLILREYRLTAETLKQLADGNWTFNVVLKSDNDRMNLSLKTMIELVSKTIGDIEADINQITTGSGEVSTAAQNLSNGAQQAAASLEEITASMSEISGQTKKNAENASRARNLAQHADKAAIGGREAMSEMTEAMDRIMKNSAEVQRVIRVIDDIAFQTNLLALNAAVEAARAGQHGKGFAVVAEEVRNLAARSAKAAKETTDLIATSGIEIEKGGEVAGHTSEVLNTIADQIKQTTDLIAGIAVACNEQAQGVSQVTIGLQQIDSVTQQNTASAEESASAANEMSGMAVKLQKLVGQFKLR